ncbi:MAG TPA: cupin domain-containing protein [Burkholderiales bacterium]|nr:cupin domain-containing protein [Burkholderiales bacterium]
MALKLTLAEAREMGLPGRRSLEIVSGEKGARAVTLRLVEIPVPRPGETPRGAHRHADFEECIYVLSGEGVTEADSGRYPLKAGDTILIPPGEAHVTRNTGTEPLVLLCFFPVADVAARSTRERSEGKI